jgi:tetratricopeptide (TPR) repeat protein
MIYQQMLGEDQEDVAICFGNMDNIYQGEERYSKALEFHRKVLAIWQKSLPVDHHQHLGSTHNNIANVYRSLGQHKLALQPIARNRMKISSQANILHSQVRSKTLMMFMRIFISYNKLLTFTIIHCIPWIHMLLILKEIFDEFLIKSDKSIFYFLIHKQKHYSTYLNIKIRETRLAKCLFVLTSILRL